MIEDAKQLLRRVLGWACVVLLISSLVLPLFDWVFPWPNANAAMKEAGYADARFMIGGGSDTHRTSDMDWREERQRSFVLIPESLWTGYIFTYHEVRLAHLIGYEGEVIRNRWFLPYVLIWTAIAFVSIRFLRSEFRRKEPNSEGSAAPERAAGPRLNKPVSGED